MAYEPRWEGHGELHPADRALNRHPAVARATLICSSSCPWCLCVSNCRIQLPCLIDHAWRSQPDRERTDPVQAVTDTRATGSTQSQQHDGVEIPMHANLINAALLCLLLTGSAWGESSALPLSAADAARQGSPAAEEAGAAERRIKTIGIIGGVSWVSSLEYYRLMNEQVRDRLGGRQRPGLRHDRHPCRGGSGLCVGQPLSIADHRIR